MLLKEVAYARPATVEEAVRLLSEHEGARPLAGGQTLINVMKARAAAPDILVDLNDLDDLRRIGRGADGGLELGAMATYSDLIASSEVNEARPVLARVASEIADVQVRNRGTIGGNVCLSDPTNHFPPLMVAMRATMTIAGAAGERTVPAEEFFLGVYVTAVGPGELLTRISIPPRQGGDGFAAVTIGKDGTCIANAAASRNGAAARVVLGCVSAVPVTVEAADEGGLVAAVRAADIEPPSDVHASAEYRRHLAEVVAVRALREAS